jgi:micrococcal nuclease
MLFELALAAGMYAIDGDTISINQERIRLENVDTPELHPCRCPAECDLGKRAHAFTQRAIASGVVTVDRTGRVDRYGRTIARVLVNGSDLGEALIAAGLGRPYNGVRRQSWCTGEENGRR